MPRRHGTDYEDGTWEYRSKVEDGTGLTCVGPKDNTPCTNPVVWQFIWWQRTSQDGADRAHHACSDETCMRRAESLADVCYRSMQLI